MTPSDRLLKAVHMALEGKRPLIDALDPSEAHQYVIRVKPRGERWFVSIVPEPREEAV